MSKAKTTSTTVNLVLVDLFGEFQGLYQDGKLLVCDNRLNLGEYIARLPKTQVFTFEKRFYPDGNDAAQAIYNNGCFPAKLSALKL